MTWWVVRVPLGPADDAEGLSARLWSWGTGGVAETQDDHGRYLIAGFEDRAAAERVAAALDRSGTSVVAVDPDGWVDPWRQASTPTRAGRLRVRAPWHPPVTDALDAGRGQVVELVIDPGPTFGHGGHPSTRLILAELDRVVEPSSTVLDVGAGSGVLAVAAAALGAARVVAVDTDPAAVEASAANARANGVVVDVRLGTVTAELGRFDVVVANLLAPVLRDLGPVLASSVAPGGRLLVAGLLVEQRDGVVEALRPLEPVGGNRDGDWALVELRADAPGVRAGG